MLHPLPHQTHPTSRENKTAQECSWDVRTLGWFLKVTLEVLGHSTDLSLSYPGGFIL